MTKDALEGQLALQTFLDYGKKKSATICAHTDGNRVFPLKS